MQTTETNPTPTTTTMNEDLKLTFAKACDASEAPEATTAEFVSCVRSSGVLHLASGGFLAKMKETMATAGKPTAPQRERMSLIFNALASTLSEAVEPLLVTLVPSMMAMLSDKDNKVCQATSKALWAFFDNLSTHSLENVIGLLLNTEGKWQALELQMDVLRSFADNRMTTQVSRALPAIIPVVSQLMWHDKAQVKKSAIATMESVSRTMVNKDLEPFLPSLIEAVLKPENVETCLERLSSTIFVAEVKRDALAVIAQVLIRGLQAHRSTATKRLCAKIIENMSKLVDDPREVAPFVPVILPILQQAKDEVPNPECREVCGKAFVQLTRSADMSRAATNILDIESVVACLNKSSLVAAQAGGAEAAALEASVVQHIAQAVMSVAKLTLESEQWHLLLTPFMQSLGMTETADCSSMVDKLHAVACEKIMPPTNCDDDDTDNLLCDCEFSLAFGSKILLNGARLKLRRGARYGLCGQNDCGKTSLMRAISRNQVDGFPDPTQVRTVFVETEIQGELSDLSVLEYIFADPLLRDCGVTRDDMAQVLMSVGFEKDGPASIDKQVGRLSGGWKMKLALARAMLLKADILLLDEPTNHLDTKNRAWVESYLQSLTHVTSIMVSHDTGFLDRVCTNILHMEHLKVHSYKGNLSAFVEQVPEAKAYFELQASKFKFKFPLPGPLEGITSKGKHIMKMTNVTFTYPTATKPQLTGVSVRVSLSSRVACVGPNGAGKSTMIKLLNGELMPDEGHQSEVWKHPNCRVAYVAQHAFHHIENHLDKTPNEYIRWRYQYGVDKEALKKSNMKVTQDELDRQAQPIMVELTDAEGVTKREKRVVKELTNGRRQERKGRRNEYEALLVGGFDQKVWLVETQLLQMGFEKAMKEVDERIAATAAGYARPLSSDFVEQHIMDVGLEREFATHTKIKALSGGQKVKVVLAAALWKCPHIIIIDEPTNYLDRESLGALAEAIKEFEGGVVIVSHNNEFCKACCPETWVLENHTLNVQGDPEWLAMSEREKVKAFVEDESDLRDAFGNTIIKMKKASRQDIKKLRKRITQMRKDGEEVDTDEEMERLGFDGLAF